MIDGTTGEPFVGVNFLLQGTGYGASTNNVGHFSFSAIPMGTYSLYVSVPGYEAITIPGVQVVSGGTSYQNLVFDALPFTVYDINDNGPYSLRHMILDANENPGKDIIHFIIPGTGPFTIQPLSALPIISDSVVIDATTQPGYSGSPLIEINGALAGSNVTD